MHKFPNFFYLNSNWCAPLHYIFHNIQINWYQIRKTSIRSEVKKKIKFKCFAKMSISDKHKLDKHNLKTEKMTVYMFHFYYLKHPINIKDGHENTHGFRFRSFWTCSVFQQNQITRHVMKLKQSWNLTPRRFNFSFKFWECFLTQHWLALLKTKLYCLS